MSKQKSEPPVVHTTARCILAGKCVLMAYDSKGKEIMGIVCRPRGYAHQWMRGGSSKRDLERMKREVAETLGSGE